jgi:hypothetical protein
MHVGGNNFDIRDNRVMALNDRAKLVEVLDRTEAALPEATSDVRRTRDTLVELISAQPGITVRELAERFHVSEDAVVAFVQTAGELLGDRPLSVEAARRAGMLAAAAQAWENELGPLLSSGQVRELLGDVSRQRVDELLRSRRLIGLRDSAGRRQFPTFQFHDGRPLESLVAAYWNVADGAASDWTAASWCVSPDDTLDGRSPAQWARQRRDADTLARVARQDAARLSR